jgi:hypothetical protein
MAVGNRGITILHYEDKPEYALSFKTSAQAQRLIVKTVDNVDDLLEQVRATPAKFKYIVLDARAFRFEGQAEGTESETYLTKIFVELEKLRAKYNVLLPCCINTGFADLKLKLANSVDCPIYDKGDEERLFSDIWDSYNGTEEAILRSKYPEVFDVADRHFAEPDIAVLSSLLTNEKYKSTLIANRVETLSKLRRTIEHLMDKLHQVYLGNPANVINSPATRAKDVINYIKRNEYLPTHIFGFTMNLLNTASNFGSHTPEQANTIADYPSGNALKSITEGMFEIFAWAKTKLN